MIKRFIKDESFQDIVEYSLLLCLVGVVAVLILTTMGESISGIFSKIASKLSTAESSIGS